MDIICSPAVIGNGEVLPAKEWAEVLKRLWIHAEKKRAAGLIRPAAPINSDS